MKANPLITIHIFFCPMTQRTTTVINEANRKTHPHKESMETVYW